MRQLFTLILLGTLINFVSAQEFPVKTIRDIQEVSAEDLATCNDISPLEGDTVTVYGVAVTDGGIAFSAGGHQIWLRDTVGAWGGLDVRDGASNGLTANLLAGDSVEIIGVVSSFRGETQIDPIDDGITILGSGSSVSAVRVDLGELNNSSRINQPVTGEKWEGVYVELVNLQVVFLDDAFSSGTRQHFTVEDENGNQIEIQDRFPAGRSNLDVGNGGLLQIPPVGTVIDTLRGVISHQDPNGDCPNSNFPAGYAIFPVRTSDVVLAPLTLTPPSVLGSTITPLTPASTEDVVISASIEDTDGTIASASLFYAVGADTESYTEIAMSNTGGTTYEATIPNAEYEDGDIIKFYVCATDNDDQMTCQPDVPDNRDPEFFVVRDNGLQIFDVQFTLKDNGDSGYRNKEVTLEGIVTSSSEPGNLNLVTIQQDDTTLTGWGGLEAFGDAALASLTVGQKVSLTGQVQESFGLTVLGNVTSVNVIGSGTVKPLEVDPAVFSSYDFATNEQYEGMLIRLVNPAGGKVYVVDQNPDGGNNFGEYRVGTDLFDPNSGSRLLVGRKTGSAPGSLNVSYVNDGRWATEAGTMEVDTCVVSYSDSMDYVQGIMHYSFNNMKLLPRNNDDFSNFEGACNASVGIKEELANSTIKVFPNPASESFELAFNFPQHVEGTVILKDLFGRTVEQKSIVGSQGKLQMPVNTLAPGTYFMLLQVNDENITYKKIVVRR